MKNYSKNNYSGKNNKQYKKNSDSNIYSENSNSSKPQITKARNDLQKNISNSLAMFDNKKFFRNDEFSVLDAVIIPILLRLDHHQIKIPNNKASKPLFDYIERMQDLPSVKESFTSLEIELL